ncbi:hypothetical protein L226DRAFT_101651 [Lentinus tigrinus ALCF2SS1-7]|uniref:uncharacterized protein n=1 Tax=Lentinus tigrinus ALCF2SS1-7 TaxID=1328758 RepID=UPI001166281F|nr:hypothetical protein L226DRAFT_101651 [Lentinus tigrinus ALCF2SS1-7]
MTAPAPDPKSVLPATVLTALQQFTSPDALPPTGLHPFSSSPEEMLSTLRRIVDTTNQAAVSLNAHLSLPLSNPKLLSLYRQHASISYAVQQSDQNMRHVVNSLRKRVGITFGEDVPLERTQLIDWFLKRLLEWGTSAGMEAFNEPESDRRIAVVMGGKVLVVDIIFAVDRTDPVNPVIDVSSLKTAYAIPNSTADSSTGNSISMDGFLAGAIRAFLKEVQKDDAIRDNVEAARIGSLLSDYFSYLMKLDHLALSEGDGGLRWFTVIDRMAIDVENLASREANVLIKGTTVAPLDVFLMRAHALPLPYLTTPSISFLTYLSPLAYLKLLRTSPAAGRAAPTPHLPSLDVPFQHLRSVLISHPRPPGITVATLVLSPTPPPAHHADSTLISAIDTKSSSTLVTDIKIDFIFPAAREVQALQGQQFTWILDFTEGGKYPGVVMSQSRMREIEFVINPFNEMGGMDNVPMLSSFGAGSWVDLLFNRDAQAQMSPERYTAVYTSPNSVHPPLQLRLTAPEEPGFILETIPVRTLKEVWSILEIVREQCWLNEILTSCEWVPEGPNTTVLSDEADDTSVTEDDLQAVLKGSVQPRSIPVNVGLPTPPPTDRDNLFADTDMDDLMGQSRPNHAKITMSTPERPPISGLVEIAVTFDPSRPRGVAVGITGAMGVDVNVEVLEEVCRRGGLMGLPGRVWKKAHES